MKQVVKLHQDEILVAVAMCYLLVKIQKDKAILKRTLTHTCTAFTILNITLAVYIANVDAVIILYYSMVTHKIKE